MPNILKEADYVLHCIGRIFGFDYKNDLKQNSINASFNLLKNIVNDQFFNNNDNVVKIRLCVTIYLSLYSTNILYILFIYKIFLVHFNRVLFCLLYIESIIRSLVLVCFNSALLTYTLFAE